jgi:hypothetical protein
MSKYDPLRTFLKADPALPLTLSFAQVELILGSELPASARIHQPWWGNDATHSHAMAWLAAGLRATSDIHQRRVTFSN